MIHPHHHSQIRQAPQPKNQLRICKPLFANLNSNTSERLVEEIRKLTIARNNLQSEIEELTRRNDSLQSRVFCVQTKTRLQGGAFMPLVWNLTDNCQQNNFMGKFYVLKVQCNSSVAIKSKSGFVHAC